MEKRFKNGLCLGKFMPFHKGHKFLIDTAIEQCETVHLMVCSLEDEPIDGLIRVGWAHQLYGKNPNVNIIWCKDENPQYEDECDTLDEFYSYWIKSVYDNIEELDAVFTSEKYGDDFARYLDVEHVLVDQERKAFPVSGTKVRENAFGVWDYVLDNVKYAYNKKVVIVGPESTGKSTLIKRLSKYYDTNYTEEYGREYTEKSGTDNLSLKDFENIADEHFYRHCRDKMKSEKILFVDTEAITTKIFAEMYLGGEVKSETIDKIIERQKFDLWLLMDIDIPWVDDGTRDFKDPEIRKNHFKRLKKVLDENNIKYHVIKGIGDDRFNSAHKYVEEILK